MSYGIIRIEKYRKGSVKGLQLHDQREKNVSHTNKDIDFSKSHLNYDLINFINISFTEKVNTRINELNLKKAIRKDAVVMCQCLITSDNSFFENIDYEQSKKFFKDSYNFISDRYGQENIISATVHFDERTPHMHVNFVPVTSDGRLCAKDLFKKNDLYRLHDDFYKFNNSMGYNLERGESKGEIQKHLTTEEFKIKTLNENIQKEQIFLNKARAALEKDKLYVKDLKDTLQAKLDATHKALEAYDNFTIMEPEKTILGGKYKITMHEHTKLVQLAKVGKLLIGTKENFDELKEKYGELQKKVDYSIKDKLKYNEQIIDAKRDYNKLVQKYNYLFDSRQEINDFLEAHNLIDDFKNYKRNLENKREQERLEEENSYDWDMEM